MVLWSLCYVCSFKMLYMEPRYDCSWNDFYEAPVMIAHWNDFYEAPVMIAHWNNFYGAPGMIGRWSEFYEPLANGFVEIALLSWSWLSLLVFSPRWEWLLAGRGSGSSWETSHEKSEMRANRLSLAFFKNYKNL